MNVGNAGHLTYCTNIHPGESWPEVRSNLERYLLSVKGQLAPRGPFGVGLRLSALAAHALAEPRTLAEFKDFLQRNGLYVFTLNGFPYGPFHGEPVKENVYLPDWKQDDRLQYTNLLADLLVELLPDDPELEGSISTVPGALRQTRIRRKRSSASPMCCCIMSRIWSACAVVPAVPSAWRSSRSRAVFWRRWKRRSPTSAIRSTRKLPCRS